MSKSKVKQFMEESGYTGYVCDCGVRKDNKRRTNWDFHTLEECLRSFQRYLNKQSKRETNR